MYVQRGQESFFIFSGLLTPCEDDNGIQTGIYGPMDPTLKSTFEFLENFFEEIVNVFPDKNLHIGGDEVELSNCKISIILFKCR